MKLGKLPPKEDSRTLMLADYVDLAVLPVPPPVIDWGSKVKVLGELGNDKVGDCAFASLGHQIQTWTANSGAEANITTEEVLAAYSAVSGYVPGDESTDTGARCLDALNYLRKVGVGGHTCLAFAKVDPKHTTMVKAALWLFGGLYTGLALPLTAQKQSVWSIDTNGTRGKGAPGSWGGHAVNFVGGATKRYELITWGALKDATLGFVQTYCDEMYALCSLDWVDGTKTAPNGFNLAQLEADLKAVTR